MFNGKWTKNNLWSLPLVLLLVLSMVLFTGCEQSSPIEGQEAVEETVEEVGIVVPDGEDASLVVEGTMQVHFIDVGQGDAVLIKQDGNNMLIDGGDNGYGGLVIDYLEAEGVESLQYVIGTHPHADHIGGLVEVIDHFPVEKVIMPDVTHTTKTFENLISVIKKKKLKITKPVVGKSFSLGEGDFTIVGPNSVKYKNLNDYSVMIRVAFGDNSFMLTGDAEVLAESEAVKNSVNLKSDVLKAGHHGSDTSSTNTFVDEVSPTFVVIQSGEGNTYGHPSNGVISRFESRGSKVYRNDLEGNIIAISDGANIEFNFTPSSRSESKGGGTTGGAISADTVEQVAPEPEVVEPTQIVDNGYIGNKNSKVFHNKTCGHLPAETNQVAFGSIDEAVGSGFRPCGFCKP